MSANQHDLITEGDHLLDKMGSIDEQLYSRVIRYLAENSKAGKIAITNEQLAGIEDILYDEIKKTDYEKNLIKYMELFNAIEAAVSRQQLEINGIKVARIKELWNSAPMKQVIKDKVVYDLGRNGLKDVFVKAIAQAVRETSYFNMDIKSAMDTLQTYLVKDNYTQRYLRSTVTGSLAEYGGAINDKVKTVYDFNIMSYIVNLVEQSRPVCVHIVRDLGRKITDVQLQAVLDEYCPNGIPNKTDYVKGKRRIVHKDDTVEFKEVMMPKGAGMVSDTFLRNWCQMCGGHANGCRHEAIWTR